MTTKTPPPDVEIIDLPRNGRRRRFTAQEKRCICCETAARLFRIPVKAEV